MSTLSRNEDEAEEEDDDDEDEAGEEDDDLEEEDDDVDDDKEDDEDCVLIDKGRGCEEFATSSINAFTSEAGTTRISSMQPSPPAIAVAPGHPLSSFK